MLKIICLVKFVPDLNKSQDIQYDQETKNLKRDKAKLIVNPEDASALAYALTIKQNQPDTFVEAVSMGPLQVEKNLKDLVRLGVDKAVLISDNAFRGSDSYATSLILSTYLEQQNFDCIFTGIQTIDGGTGHIGPQIAEVMKINQFSDVLLLDRIEKDSILVEAAFDEQIVTLEIQNPSVISMSSSLKMKLGFVKSEDFDKNVDYQFEVVTNDNLKLPDKRVGRKGSPTIVRKEVSLDKKLSKAEKQVVKGDNDGVEVVYRFLREQGYV